MGRVMRRPYRGYRWAPSGILHQTGRGSPWPGPVGAEGRGQGVRGGGGGKSDGRLQWCVVEQAIALACTG